MPQTLERQLQAYQRLRPQILADHQPGWALIANEELIRVFEEFEDASSYADQNYPNDEVLIRHTSEHRGVAPFIFSKK